MGKHLTASLSAALAITLCACTAIDPSVDYPLRHTTTSNLNTTAHLDQAIARLISARNQMQNNAQEQTIIRTVSNSGILVGALATIGLAVYGASKDAIIGGGLFTGASYGLGTVFAPRSYDAVYRAGIRALICVDGAASPSAAIVRAIPGPLGKLDETLAELRKLVDRGKLVAPITPRLSEALTAADAALTKGAQARSIADRILAAEGLIAADVNRSVDSVISVVNDQIAAQQPDAAAVLAIAQSIPLVGLGGLKQAQSDALGLADEARKQRSALLLPRGVGAAAPVVDPNEALAKEIENASARVLTTAEVISQSPPISVDAARTALAGCRVDEITTPPLTASTNEIEVAAGQTYTFTVRGGKAPYSSRFLGVRLDNIDVDSNGIGVFYVRGLTGLATGKETFLQVTDASPGTPQQIEVKVKTK